MATDAMELRLRFLKESACYLAVSSPTISSALGSAHRTLLAADNKDLELPAKEVDALRREICGSCGNVMMPGWTGSVSREARRNKRDQTKPPKEPSTHVLYTCMRCHRKTVQNLHPRPSKHMSKRVSSGGQPPASTRPEVVDGKVTKSASATSKQRKKARKGGLQAMLEKSKADSASGGLDLMDFLA